MLLPLLAEATGKVTPMQKIQSVSGQFWLKLILAFVALAVFIFVAKKIMAMNKIILVIILFVVVGIVGFRWIYERDEPSFLTPIIEPIAASGFFPTKGVVENKDNTKTQPQKPSPNNPAPAKK